ncbi:uncharacterized protein MYCGRDRAFT_97808 [Zymoseptoria tritici IPO323]|uniref:Uncharacterized protein n=1 Tax=Zymoseptoria tritici (strain CBS 115943 / IPO323) TaxID=336722 RepID=F9XRF7_ZYMTI|nr:uncharacterized protein MYCGRDRAFT_97808 [Zymoseptoria tritici IPO323]EGP82174.1 hypothetical protein MYCGRDRAFT_97808 [Zymoseptoria tritici IPO323]
MSILLPLYLSDCESTRVPTCMESPTPAVPRDRSTPGLKVLDNLQHLPLPGTASEPDIIITIITIIIIVIIVSRISSIAHVHRHINLTLFSPLSICDWFGSSLAPCWVYTHRGLSIPPPPPLVPPLPSLVIVHPSFLFLILAARG